MLFRSATQRVAVQGSAASQRAAEVGALRALKSELDSRQQELRKQHIRKPPLGPPESPQTRSLSNSDRPPPETTNVLIQFPFVPTGELPYEEYDGTDDDLEKTLTVLPDGTYRFIGSALDGVLRRDVLRIDGGRLAWEITRLYHGQAT